MVSAVWRSESIFTPIWKIPAIRKITTFTHNEIHAAAVIAKHHFWL